MYDFALYQDDCIEFQHLYFVYLYLEQMLREENKFFFTLFLFFYYHEDFHEFFVLHVQSLLIFLQLVELDIRLDQHRKINFEFPNK
jgi:hypothetical protein